MRNLPSFKCWLLLFSILLCNTAFASDATTNVSGTWTVNASNGRRRITQTIVIEQDGEKIKGTFKGPRQSGTLDGSVSGKSIHFHVTAKTPLDYVGGVDGEKMSGTLSGNGMTGDWTATRMH